MNNVEMKVIAIVESCYKQKFAIPRQSGLAPSAKAKIRFLPEYSCRDFVEGLELSSHIWVQFVFHEVSGQVDQARVRPPRMGGNRKMGVFATRSTHRPNPLGLSVVKLERIDLTDGVVLEVSGIDLLQGTPVLDIKPYLPYADCVSEASNEFALDAPAHIQVSFSEEASQQIVEYEEVEKTKIHNLIVEVLRQDPRPAYQKFDESRVYGVSILNFNLCWKYKLSEQADCIAEYIEVISLEIV